MCGSEQHERRVDHVDRRRVRVEHLLLNEILERLCAFLSVGERLEGFGGGLVAAQEEEIVLEKGGRVRREPAQHAVVLDEGGAGVEPRGHHELVVQRRQPLTLQLLLDPRILRVAQEVAQRLRRARVRGRSLLLGPPLVRVVWVIQPELAHRRPAGHGHKVPFDLRRGRGLVVFGGEPVLCVHVGAVVGLHRQKRGARRLRRRVSIRGPLD